MQIARRSLKDAVETEITDGEIVMTPMFRHRSLKERAEEYGGRLNLAGEIERDEPKGRELW